MNDRKEILEQINKSSLIKYQEYKVNNEFYFFSQMGELKFVIYHEDKKWYGSIFLQNRESYKDSLFHTNAQEANKVSADIYNWINKQPINIMNQLITGTINHV